jgi:hypothetical protein
MGQEKAGVEVEAQPAKEAERLEVEIGALRDEIGDSLAELDRRRREAMDVQLQISRHAVPVAVAAAGVGLVLGGALLYVALKRRHDHKPEVVARRRRKAAMRIYEHPERVARNEGSMHMKILTAGLTALAGAMAKKMVERTISSRTAVVIPSAPITGIAVQRPFIGEAHHRN